MGLHRLKLVLAAGAVAVLVGVAGADSADTFAVRIVSQTSSTITLGWSAQPGYGYLFSSAGNVVSRTNDPSRTSVKFSKVTPASYDIDVIVKGSNGHYPIVTEPPPKAQCEDGADNDNDNKTDYPQDPGCSSATDNDETDPVQPPPGTGSFPNAANTGVPDGTSLTAYTGPQAITTAGTVIDSKTVTGSLEIRAANVTIRNSRILGSVFLEDAAPATNGNWSVRIEDSEIDCRYQPGATGVVEAHITILRSEISHCENGFSVNQDMVIQDNYIHDLDFAEGAHTDGIQLSFGYWNGSAYVCCARNVTIRHNTILAADNQGHFATSAIISNKNGPDENVSIDNNLMAGGAYTLYCDQNGFKGTNYTVTNNHFSTRYKATVGFYGPATDCSDETQSGNVIDETGQPLRLG